MKNDTRAWEILDAVVHLNIETGRPVSSGLVERLLRKAYSSATIRAVMKRLEHDGYLLRVGIQGRYIAPEDRDPALLIFVIDVSGSMNREDRLGVVGRRVLHVLSGRDGRSEGPVAAAGARP